MVCPSTGGGIYATLSPTYLFQQVFLTIMGLFSMPMEFLEITGLFFIGTKIRETIASGRLNINVETLPAQIMQSIGQVIMFAAIAPAYQVILNLTQSVRTKPTMS